MLVGVVFRMMRFLRPGREATITAVHISAVHHASVGIVSMWNGGLVRVEEDTYFRLRHRCHSRLRRMR